ncbi:hypothetical protein CRUP_011176 [Coryphaenoides rupestris]|nr:hypothetical protein CRUP_011176 [Coryphaenoides rupestris]
MVETTLTRCLVTPPDPTYPDVEGEEEGRRRRRRRRRRREHWPTHTLDGVRQLPPRAPDRAPPFPTDRAPVDQELISRQMNSVFKELLSRHPPLQHASPASLAAATSASLAVPAPPATLSTSSSSTALAQPPTAAKKGGFGLRGRALF